MARYERHPSPPRLSIGRGVCARLDSVTLVTLNAGAYRAVPGRLAAAGIGGGRSDDALIVASANQARFDLFTFNPRDFDPAPLGVAVVDPSTGD